MKFDICLCAALHCACDVGCVEVVSLLLDAGAKDSAESDGFTALDIAKAQGFNNCATLIEDWKPAPKPAPPSLKRKSNTGAMMSARMALLAAPKEIKVASEQAEAPAVKPKTHRRIKPSVKKAIAVNQVSALLGAGLFEGASGGANDMEEFEEECRKTEAARQASRAVLKEGGMEALAAEAARLKAEVMASLNIPTPAPAAVDEVGDDDAVSEDELSDEVSDEMDSFAEIAAVQDSDDGFQDSDEIEDPFAQVV